MHAGASIYGLATFLRSSSRACETATRWSVTYRPRASWWVIWLPTVSRPPTVSVVVPVRDGARVIRRCLDALQSQSVADLELIVVDDGSVDRTIEVAQCFGVKVLS